MGKRTSKKDAARHAAHVAALAADAARAASRNALKDAFDAATDAARASQPFDAAPFLALLSDEDATLLFARVAAVGGACKGARRSPHYSGTVIRRSTAERWCDGTFGAAIVSAMDAPTRDRAEQTRLTPWIRENRAQLRIWIESVEDCAGSPRAMRIMPNLLSEAFGHGTKVPESARAEVRRRLIAAAGRDAGLASIIRDYRPGAQSDRESDVGVGREAFNVRRGDRNAADRGAAAAAHAPRLIGAHDVAAMRASAAIAKRNLDARQRLRFDDAPLVAWQTPAPIQDGIVGPMMPDTSEAPHDADRARHNAFLDAPHPLPNQEQWAGRARIVADAPQPEDAPAPVKGARIVREGGRRILVR